MKLTDKQCAAARLDKGTKLRKLSDGHGLYLLVKADGGKYWRQKYNYTNKEKTLALGVYPEVSLKEAREKAQAARKLLAEGVDPALYKKQKKREALLNAHNTFKAVALEWHNNKSGGWSEGHTHNVLHRLETDIFPYLGDRPIADIDAPELLSTLRKIEKRGALDIAHRALQLCGQVFRYGIATGRGKRDHAHDLKGALKTTKTRHFPALDIREMPEFLQALARNDVRLYPRTRRAVMLLMLTFVRTTEMIEASWDEINLETAEWRIPAHRMKMKQPHIVPLSKQAVALLAEQREETRHLNTKWVFPSQIRPIDPMSNGTILGAIKRLGFKGRMTGHGFRALAMTAIKEKLGYRHEVVDRQLAHGHRNKVNAAYDRAMFLDERKVMMQQWADYIDAITQDQGNKVIFAQFGTAA